MVATDCKFLSCKDKVSFLMHLLLLQPVNLLIICTPGGCNSLYLQAKAIQKSVEFLLALNTLESCVPCFLH